MSGSMELDVQNRNIKKISPKGHWETLVKSVIRSERGLLGNYSLKYYCFLKINSTFANRN